MALSGERLSIINRASLAAEVGYYADGEKGFKYAYRRAAQTFWSFMENHYEHFTLDEVNILKNIWRDAMIADERGPPIIETTVFVKKDSKEVKNVENEKVKKMKKAKKVKKVKKVKKAKKVKNEYISCYI